MKQIMVMAFWTVASMAGAQTDSLLVDSLVQRLPEVMVKGERPLVRAERGRLLFDLPHLIEGKGVSTAYEALKELPGVTEQDERLLLTGRSVTVVIGGKASTMTTGQLMQLLKTMPANRIRNAEVMFAAPARYGVKGQVINLNLRHDETQRALQGQARLGCEQKHDAMFSETVSLFGQDGRWSVDAMYGLQHGRSFYEGTTQSLHSLATGERYDIRSHSQVPSSARNHQWRMEVDYGTQFILAYTGSRQNSRNSGKTEGSIASAAQGESRHAMHNLRADISLPFGLKAGADYTFYDAPSTGVVSSMLPTGALSYELESEQRIDRWKLFASMEHQLPGHWGLNYGASFATTRDCSHQYFNLEGMNSSVDLREDVTNLYVGGSKSWGKRFSFDLSLAAERFSNEAFGEWALFPTLTVSYTPKDGHLLQLSLAGNRNYPEYWAVTTAKGFTDGGYGEVAGNPGLRPAKDYQVQMVYLLHSKYQVACWFGRVDDYFVQTSYQRQDRLAMDYRHVNFDFHQQGGLMAYAPVRMGTWLQSAASVYLLWNREKDSDYYDLPFDRRLFGGMLNLRNTITFSPAWSMNVNVFARTKSYQGLYDLPASGNLSVELLARLLKQRLSVKVFADNLLRTNAIKPEMHYKTQHYTMGYTDYRTLGITATYTVGGYKEKRHPQVDTSRFRNN